ncbi:MAG: hypothetical protein R3264_19455 [Anaerolineae bacterium]|nr:hypothetical protein [Anaerolineae bacterium]
MFFRGGVFRILFVLLLIGGLLSLGGFFGWSQGYTAGLAAADGGARAVGPYPVYGFGFFPFFWGFGLIFKLGLLLLFFLFIGKIFRFWRWRGAGGPQGSGWGGPGHYHPHGDRHHHRRPPWADRKGGPRGDTVDDEPSEVV